jgi:hypothetical protein
MKSLKLISRNVAIVALLSGAVVAMSPAQTLADQCVPIAFENWGGMCAGPYDACMYFMAECDYHCFVLGSGSLCIYGLQWCAASNWGSEEWPNYCLDNGWCYCSIY